MSDILLCVSCYLGEETIALYEVDELLLSPQAKWINAHKPPDCKGLCESCPSIRMLPMEPSLGRKHLEDALCCLCCKSGSARIFNRD